MVMIMMMGGDDEKERQNTMFHDFFGMSSNDVDGIAASKKMDADIISGSSDLGSERLGTDNSEVFYFHGKKNAVSEPDANNPLSGRKRSSSSPYTSLIRDRMLSSGSDSFENSRLLKAFGKSHDDDATIPSSMQPPPRPTSSLLLHQPIRHNPCPVGQLPSRFSQSGSYMEKLNVGPTLIPQAAADEGSRTGMKGLEILKLVNSSGTNGPQPYINRRKVTQIVEPESSNMPSHHNLVCSSQQMTIFYAGQAHVFDDVPPNKADVIIALAGSNGASWSTNYTKLGVAPPVREAKTPIGEKELGIDLKTLASGGYQGEEASQVPRQMTSMKEHDTNGKK